MNEAGERFSLRGTDYSTNHFFRRICSFFVQMFDVLRNDIEVKHRFVHTL